MEAGATSSLQLFEKEYLNEFTKTNITAIVAFENLIIFGDYNGYLNVYKKENKNLSQVNQIQVAKTKIDTLIVVNKEKILYILTGGNLLVYEIPDFNSKTPKDTDKESKDLKDVVKIVGNQSEENSNQLCIITKKKKLLFFTYQTEMKRLIHNEFKDAEGKSLEYPVKEIPEKIKWCGKYLCYYLKKESKVYFLTFNTEKDGKTKVTQQSQEIPVDDIEYIQSSWIVLTGGFGLFFSNEGEAVGKDMINLNMSDTYMGIEIYNDIYIVILYKGCISVYDYNDGKCVQELTTDTTTMPISKFLSKGIKNIYMVSTYKPNEKTKVENYDTKLWEIRELSFETQIQILLKHNQLVKAFGILNNKLDYNMEKFVHLENFYCECAWNCFQQKDVNGYKEAEKYFCLCNFNPFELIYHFIKLLNIKPIHDGYKDVDKLSNDVLACQITCEDNKINDVTKAALEMLVKVLRVKKNYILTSNNLPTVKAGNDKLFTESMLNQAKSTSLTFESSNNNNVINLKDVAPVDPKLDVVIEMINLVLVKAMVLSQSNEVAKIEYIQEIIENDAFDTNYLLDDFFIKLDTYEAHMALAYIYNRTKKYSEALKLLQPYLDDVSKSKENKESRRLTNKILTSFGKNAQYVDVFEEGLRYLLKMHQQPAFEILLSHELISIDTFLDKILPDFDKENNSKKREAFLKLLCEDKKYENYSNEKYQTMFIELNLEKLFIELPKDAPIKKKTKTSNIEDELPGKYKDFKELLRRHKKYNKLSILEKVKNSWMHDVEIYLLTELQKYDDALLKLIDLKKNNFKDFEDIRAYCKLNYKNDANIYKKYFKYLRDNFDSSPEKDEFKTEMLKLLELFIDGNLLDPEEKKNLNKLELLNILNPKDIMPLIPNEWKLNELLGEKSKDKTLFSLLRFYLKEYAVINNNYKRLENLAKMDLTYKQMKLYELKDKHVSLDVNSNCYLCGKKILTNTMFLVYPNGHIYHNKCATDLHSEPKTGRNFKNFDY